MSDARWQLIALIPAAYAVGSIPFGLLVGLAKGIDVRKSGSGNIGATNVARLLGGRFFALVFTLDLLKGMLPVLAAGYLLRGKSIDFSNYIFWLLIGFAAIAGHMFSLFLKFRGGKGVATSAGVLLGIFPYFTYPALIGAAVAIVAFGWTRFVSVASIAGAITFPVAYIAIGLAMGWPITGLQLPFLFFALLLAALIVYKHRSNISRLRAGTEHRVGQASGSR